MVVQRWSRDVVVREIQHLNEEGKDLTHGEASTNYQRLVSAAVRYFGSWGAAVAAAGIDYAGIRRKSQDARSARVTKWSIDSISAEIRSLVELGESLAAATVRQKHPALFSAAVSPRYFGSWRNALTAVGLDYDLILAQNRASSTAPRDARGMRTVMRRMQVLGDNVRNMTDAQAQTRYPKLYEKAATYFGTWNAALEAAFGDRNL